MISYLISSYGSVIHLTWWCTLQLVWETNYLCHTLTYKNCTSLPSCSFEQSIQIIWCVRSISQSSRSGIRKNYKNQIKIWLQVLSLTLSSHQAFLSQYQVNKKKGSDYTIYLIMVNGRPELRRKSSPILLNLRTPKRFIML